MDKQKNYIYLSPLKENNGTHKLVKTVIGRVSSNTLEELAKQYNVSTEDFEWYNEREHKENFSWGKKWQTIQNTIMH